MSPDALVFYINLYWKRFSETVALFSNALQKIGNCSDSHQLLSNNIQRLSAGASIMAPFCRPRPGEMVEDVKQGWNSSQAAGLMH